jgi:hypothetical protein
VARALAIFASSLAALLSVGAAAAQPPPAAIDQVAPLPSPDNRAATPADNSVIGQRPAQSALGRADQIPVGATATTDDADSLTAASSAGDDSACSTGARIDDVLAHLPASAASAVDACATLSWLEDEREAREREDALNSITAAIENEAAQQRASEQRRPSPRRTDPVRQ